MMVPARKEPDSSTYSGRFAIRLKQLREKAGLTVEQVADQLGLTATAVYHWESGLHAPKAQMFPNIAKIYKLKKVKDILPNE